MIEAAKKAMERIIRFFMQVQRCLLPFWYKAKEVAIYYFQTELWAFLFLEELTITQIVSSGQ